MNFNHPNRDGSTIILRMMCAIIFLVFSFLWLYFFQADLMAVTQHVLSGGRTIYNPVVGTLLIVAGLWLLQLVTAAVLKLYKLTHALTYLPSLLVLALLTGISTDGDGHVSLGVSWWVIPLVLVAWLLTVLLAKIYQSVEPDEPGGLFSRRVWMNVLVLALMMIGVVAISNTQAAFHYRAHAEVAMMKGNYNEALRVGEKSLESDPSLTMLRIYALARKNELGERLFHYPISLCGADILPLAQGKARMLIYPADSIYRFLGAIPKKSVKTSAEYLQLLEQKGKATDAVRDYQLCGMLIDKDIDRFARSIGMYYTVNDSLPRHYREALVLYRHLRSRPVVIYHNEVLEADYADFQDLENQFADKRERKVRVGEKYEGCYWYYYFYL